MDPGWEIRTEFWSEIPDLPLLLGELDGVLVRKCGSELLIELDGDVVGRSERGCCLVQRMGPGLVNCGIYAGLGQWTVGCLEMPEPSLYAHFY